MVTYSTNLSITLPAFGEYVDTWGSVVNVNLGTLIEQAIVGNGAVTMLDATTTITMTDGSSSAARCFFLTLSGAITAQRDLVVPTINKPYMIVNSTTGGFGVNVRTSGGTGIVVPANQKRLVYVDGTNVIEAQNSFGNITANGTLTTTGNTSLGGTLAVAGATTLSSTLAVSGTVSGAGFTSLFASPPPIGSSAASTGAFTTLSASSTVSGAGITALMASPGPIGSTVASTGAFTTLSASSTVSGAGFSTYLASPPAIGGSAPAAGAFTTLSATSTVSGNGIVALMASPGPIGNTVPSTGAFTTLSASSTVSGTGFSTYLASPPAIGGSSPAAGAFTTLTASSSASFAATAVTTLSATSTVSGAGFTALFASPPAIGGTSPSTGAFTTLSATGAITGSSATITNAVTAATITANTTVSGSGFTTYLASPPAIGGSSPAAITGTTVTATTLTVNGNGSVTGTLSVSTAINGPSATITTATISSLSATSVTATNINGTVGNITPAAGTFTTVTPTVLAGAVYNSGNNRFGQNSTDSPGVSNTTTGSALPTSGIGYFSYDGSALNVNRNSNGTIATFYRSGNTPGGGIDITTTTLAFTAVSDYRKKKNWKPMVDALKRLNLLRPLDFQWISNDEWAEGFLAHELQEVVPGAVFGEKDDETRFQAVDPGKIVPLLVAALKELSAEVADLKARLA